MAKHRTAMGKAIDMDMMRLANETAIAIGNAKTNARGDELGQGGKIVKTRAQIMQEYYAMNAAVADDTPLTSKPVATPTAPAAKPQIKEEKPVVIAEEDKQLDDELDGGVETAYVKPRGSLAEAVAEEKEVTQTLLTPPSKTSGIQRI